MITIGWLNAHEAVLPVMEINSLTSGKTDPVCKKVLRESLFN